MISLKEARYKVVPLTSFLTGCAAMVALMTVPFVPIVLGLAAIVTGVRGRSYGDPIDRAMTAVGIAFGVAAVALCWMTPGFVTIIWGG
ncbi:MAG: hypothetical protein ABI083_01545 [Lapillicoccus sp.]